MFKNIGNREIRTDAMAKVLGKATYPQDIYMEDMVYLKTFRSKSPHAYIKVDVSEAEKVEGVLKVFTAKDIPGKNHHGVVLQDHNVLCDKKVRRIGDPIALVVAETAEIAEEALEKIVVKYDEIEPLFSPIRAMEEDAPRVHEEEDEEENKFYHLKIRKGDVEKAFKESDVIVEGTFNTPSVDHAFLQPEAGVSYMEAGKLIVCVSTQYPHYDRGEISVALGLAEEEIRVINPTVGGAFGGREDISMQIHLALAAKTLNRPVKAIYEREESFYGHSKRHPYTMEYKAGASSEGKILAMEVNIVGDAGAYASWGMNVLRKGAVHATGPYEVPNVKIDSKAVYTNNPYTGAMRGFGATQPPVGAEQIVESLAEKLNMDPVEFRRKNFFKAGSVTATGQELVESVPIRRCMDEVSKKLDSIVSNSKEKNSDVNKRRGVGYGATFYGTGYGNGFPDVSCADVELNKDGKINLYVGATECGQGSDTIMRQISAESFKSNIGIINYYNTDTDKMEDSGTAAATRQTYNTGNAVRLASDKLRDSLLVEAKEILGLNTTVGLVISDETIYLKTYKEISITFEELAKKLGEKTLREREYFTAHSTEIDMETGQGCPYWPYAFGACGVEVEVDMETGLVEIKNAVSAQDTGRAINPELVEGQMDGGFAMGVGFALFEDLNIVNGEIKNNKFSKYLIPTSMDTPNLEKIIIEDPESTAPYGAKGIGEPVMTYVAPAILNAIYDATGVRIYELPATPEKVLKAIKQK